MNIEFTCANCGAGLKVLQAFAGKTIQCPKCAKKTAVPGGPDKEPDASSAAPDSKKKAAAPAVPVSPPPASPAPPVDASAAKPDEAAAARLRERELKLEGLTREIKAMEERLDVARLRAERAEQEKQALATQKGAERARLEAELAAHFQAELEAARKTIARMEEKIREATAERIEQTQSTGRTAAQIEKELLENPEDALMESETLVPDAVLSDIRQSRFGRYLRLAILMHAIVLGLTSIAYIKNRISPPPPPEEAGEGATNAVSAAVSAVSTGTTVEASVASETGAVAEAATPAAAAPQPASETAKALESLPTPGEKPPTDTQVQLGL